MKRTKQVSEQLDKLENVRIFFEELAGELQEELDEKSDAFQESDKGQQMSEEIEALQDAARSLKPYTIQLRTKFFRLMNNNFLNL